MAAGLVAPDLAFMPSFVDALREGFRRDTQRAETPEAIAAIAADHAGHIAEIRNPSPSVTLPDGRQVDRVPETILWLVEGETFLGSVGIRHHLNPNLELWGGHIGYAVRPAAWGRGHASAMLAQALTICRASLGLGRVLLTVNTANPASIRVIEKNGGRLTDTIPHPFIDGDFGRRYWIELGAND